MDLNLGLNLAAFLYCDGFGCNNFYSTGFGFIMFFWNSSQLLFQLRFFGSAGYSIEKFGFSIPYGTVCCVCQTNFVWNVFSNLC